ncbi:MAG: winged helix-turn-helix transcriptional regulator [Candidatus Omnitrophota bacterium]|nr:winged helix-turn-helix transcriptional regulator [Candidatus Omnitrophota bacterium]
MSPELRSDVSPELPRNFARNFGTSPRNFPRNFPELSGTLARIFRIIRLSENIGSGFHKMFTGWTSYYKRKPVVEGDFDYYKITFYLAKKEELSVRVTERVTKKVAEKVTENQIRIIAEMEKNPYVTAVELKEIIGISRKGILENIAKLKAKKMIDRKGPNKGGHWLVLKLPGEANER